MGKFSGRSGNCGLSLAKELRGFHGVGVSRVISNYFRGPFAGPAPFRERAILWIFLVLLSPPVSWAAADCRVAGGTRLKIGDTSSVSSNLLVNSSGGVIRLLGGVTLADDTTTTGAAVRLGPRTRVFDLLANTIETGTGAQIRGTQSAAPALPFEADFCALSQTPGCGQGSLRIARRSVSTPLSAGDYGRVVVGSGATLKLAAGQFRFCELRVARGARVLLAGGASTSVFIRDRLKLGREAVLSSSEPSALPLVEVAGTSVHLASKTTVAANFRAPSASFRARREHRFVGNLCAYGVSIGRNANVECVAPLCGDGLFDVATEQCDPPHDAACAGACTFDCSCPASSDLWRFVDVTESAGAVTAYEPDLDLDRGSLREVGTVAGGVAAGDFDGDGWVDLFTVGGALGRSRLLHNRGDGTFEEISSEAGLAVEGIPDSGPSFADIDGDGDLDLIVGAILGATIRVYENNGGVFSDVSDSSGLVSSTVSNMGTSFGDVDSDGDLDLFVSHWFSRTDDDSFVDHLWVNDGDGHFEGGDAAAGLDLFNSPPGFSIFTWTFTGGFADVSGDGAVDLLVAADFGSEQYFLGDGAGSFTEATGPVNTSENGMGQAIADYDNDGDLDWFISSIFDPNGVPEANWGTSGNRLYRNLGDGSFEDVTEQAGVREGFWGWGACFADFNLDGRLDLFHVNGFTLPDIDTSEFDEDPSRLFLGRDDDTFVESSLELGLDDRGQGRGVVCFDYDRDGDIDLFVANAVGQSSRLYRNDGVDLGSFLQVRLVGRAPNTQAAGARVYVRSGLTTQMREIQIGSNYVSQNPAVAHFGLGSVDIIDEMRIVWPNGAVTVETDVETGRFLIRNQP
ncbi:MAG: hypothetical protein ACI8TX_001591 [Hyphomicrobiaceae bacterium]